MKRKHYICMGTVALCIIAILYLLRNQPPLPAHEEQPIATSQSASLQSPVPASTVAPTPLPSNPVLAQQEIQEEKWKRAFSFSINFYGKAVDEKGVPIEGAKVRYSAPSSVAELGKGVVEGPTTGANGLFSITGKQGAGIYVSVSHPNYYETPQSYGRFSYFEDTERNPTPDNPAVFVLRKKGTSEPLLKLKQVVKSVPKDGRPVQIGLSSKQTNDLRLEVWTSPPQNSSQVNAPFDWKMRITVPGGGLVAYKDQYQFQAPESSYLPSVEFAMPAAGVDGKWRSDFEETYFLKLGNGNYARMRFQMIAGGNHFAVVESYYNPSGSRNLEYNPNLTVQK